MNKTIIGTLYLKLPKIREIKLKNCFINLN